MKLSRALTLAAGGLEPSPDRLQAIAQRVARQRVAGQRGAGQRGADPATVALDAAKPCDRRESERRRAANIAALQSCRNLIVRTLAMLA